MKKLYAGGRIIQKRDIKEANRIRRSESLKVTVGGLDSTKIHEIIGLASRKYCAYCSRAKYTLIPGGKRSYSGYLKETSRRGIEKCHLCPGNVHMYQKVYRPVAQCKKIDLSRS